MVLLPSWSGSHIATSCIRRGIVEASGSASRYPAFRHERGLTAQHQKATRMLWSPSCLASRIHGVETSLLCAIQGLLA